MKTHDSSFNLASLLENPYLHPCGFQRIKPVPPWHPHYSPHVPCLSETLVNPVQIGVVAAVVPPSTAVLHGAAFVLVMEVIVTIARAEREAIVIRQSIT